jgi:hypothetical protein
MRAGFEAARSEKRGVIEHSPGSDCDARGDFIPRHFCLRKEERQDL